MQLISVHVGQARAIQNGTPSGRTGIYKLPVSDLVEITNTGLHGDAICDSENHGGTDQAVYVYGTSDYAWWSKELGRELLPGTFGENLTITDLESSKVSIGDRFHVGSVILEVTAPRGPCVTLAARMGDASFVKRFRAAERPGVYCRVIQTGYVHCGDLVTLQRYTDGTITALELFRAYYAADLDEATLRRHLAAPIATRDRIKHEKRLETLVTAKSRVSPL